jgi:hypothetical protein
MSNKLSEIKFRLRKFVGSIELSHRKFNQIIDASDSFLKSDGGFNVDYLPIIRQKYPDLNMDWLLFNEGNMLLSSENSVVRETQYKIGKEVSSDTSNQYQFNVIYDKLQEVDCFMEAMKLKFEIDKEIEEVQASLKK